MKFYVLPERMGNIFEIKLFITSFSIKFFIVDRGKKIVRSQNEIQAYIMHAEAFTFFFFVFPQPQPLTKNQEYLAAWQMLMIKSSIKSDV